MGDINSEAILEVFELENKYIYCSYLEEGLLQGLIKRGAKVWVDEQKYHKLLPMKTLAELKDQVNSSANPPNYFDYSIASDLKTDSEKTFSLTPVSKKIVLLDGILRVLKWNFFSKRRFKNNIVSIYSVAPSFKNIRLVIPEKFNIPLERYWTLISLNPLVFTNLIISWFITRNHSLRRLFIPKIIVIK